MSAVVQLVIVCVLVAAAGLYVARASWRTWFGRGTEKGCGAGCGTCTAAAPEPKREGRFPLPQV